MDNWRNTIQLPGGHLEWPPQSICACQGLGYLDSGPGRAFCKSDGYSLMFWLPLYLIQRLKYSPGEAGYTSSLFELVGFGGAPLGGDIGQVHDPAGRP